MKYRSNLELPPFDFESFYTDDQGLSELVVYPRPDTMGHDAPSSRRFDPNCGFLTHDEGAVLYNVGRASKGTWVDIGSRLLWSTLHLRAAVEDVYAVDVEYSSEPFRAAALSVVKRARQFAPKLYPERCPQCEYGEILKLADGSWTCRTGGCELSGTPAEGTMFDGPVFACTSDDFFTRTDGWISPTGGSLAGVMVDGNHDSPCPLNDAKNAAAALEQRGVIVFHDVLGQPIRDGILWLLENGFQGRLYYTPRMMAVCWRGDIQLPEHTPDPRIDWEEVRFGMIRHGGADMLRRIHDTKGKHG